MFARIFLKVYFRIIKFLRYQYDTGIWLLSGEKKLPRQIGPRFKSGIFPNDHVAM